MTKDDFIKKYGEVIRMTVPLLLPEFEKDVNDLVSNTTQYQFEFTDPDELYEYKNTKDKGDNL